jgi:hypothetical protein
MSSTYNHVRNKRGEDQRGMEMFILEEVEHQERLEAAGYRSPTWKVLRALQSLMSAAQLQGESSVTDPPFFPNADRGTVPFWWKEQGRWRAAELVFRCAKPGDRRSGRPTAGHAVALGPGETRRVRPTLRTRRGPARHVQCAEPAHHRTRTCNSDTKRLACVEPSSTNKGGPHTERI